MPNFTYVEIDERGKRKKGSLEAVDISQARAILKDDGKMLMELSEAGRINSTMNITLFEKKPKPRDLAVYCRQFVSISAAGVPVISALEMVGSQTENELLAAATEECRKAIQAGSSLSEAMQEHPKIFPSLFVTMVASGEASGSLETAFDRMGEQFEKESRLRAMVKKASIYPIMVCFVAVAVIMVLLAFVIPRFEETLTGMSGELPAVTVFVMDLGGFMQSNWYFVLAGMLLIFFGLRFYSKTAMGKRVFGTIQLKLPLFGKLAVKTASARLCRTLSTLVAAGIPLIEALEITANTMDNVYFKEALMEARDDVAMGAPLSEPLVRSGQFPPLVCHMTSIGENVGDLEGMLNKLADYYDEEVEATTATVMAAIEPMIIVVLAVIVAGIVFTVMLPLMDIYENVENL